MSTRITARQKKVIDVSRFALMIQAMETDIQKIENRIRGAGVSVSAFLEKNMDPPIPRSTWTGWKNGSPRTLERWIAVVKAVEALEE